MGVFFFTVFKIVLGVMVFTTAFLWNRELPDGLFGADPVHRVPADSVVFLADKTWLDSDGSRRTDQEIWDTALTLIDEAHRYVLMDMFLFNDFNRHIDHVPYRALSSEVLTHLVEKRKSDRMMSVSLIVDPINTVYGGAISSPVESLKSVSGMAFTSALLPLIDSHLVWSAFWRPFFSWFGNSTEAGWLPHPLDYDSPKVTLRTWAALFNFKANHRGVMVVDHATGNRDTDPVKMVTLVTSAYPHDAGSSDMHVGLMVKDAIWKDVVTAEARVAQLSDLELPGYIKDRVTDETGDVSVALLRERALRDTLMARLDEAGEGDTLRIMSRALADRTIIDALVRAYWRGADILLLLDPNSHAMGYASYGLPNRPVARELQARTEGGITIRWCDISPDACGAKLVIGDTASSSFMIVGSANLTRRALDARNLEMSILATRASPFHAWEDAVEYFDDVWTNADGHITVPYEVYQDTTYWRTPVYRVVERTGTLPY